MNHRPSRWRTPSHAFLASGAIGLVIFIFIYGVLIIDPSYTAWLRVDGGDLSQSYMGWQFYRASGWHFPIGLIDGLIYPNLISVMYIDSIPLLGLIFKVLSPLLPINFQYFGIWGAICFVLQGGIAALLIWKFDKRIIPCLIGSVFFIISPMVLDRLYGHTALAGQWILLAAMILWVYRQEIGTTKQLLLAWSGLFFISPLIHSYFAGMLAFMLLGFLLLDFIETRDIKRVFILLFGSGISLLTSMFLIGAFHGSIAVDEGGIGAYGLNLLWFVNPQQHSAFLPPIEYARAGQYEGFSYLGLGLLFMATIAIGKVLFSIFFKKELLQQNTEGFIYVHRLAISAIFTALLLLVYAILPVASVGSKTLWKPQLPSILENLWNTFRSTGRFVWPVWYLICCSLIVHISRISKRVFSNSVLIAALLIQIIDLSPMISGIHERHSERKSYTSTMATSEWEEVAGCIKHIVFMDANISGDSQSFPILDDVGEYAIKHKLTLNNYHLSRRNDKEVEDELLRQLANPDPDTLYFAPNISNVYPQDAEIYYFSNRLVILFANSNRQLHSIISNTPALKYIEIPINTEHQSYSEDTLELKAGEHYDLNLSSLPAGKYMLEFSGSYMRGYSFEIICNEATIDYEVYKSRPSMTSIVFELNETNAITKLKAINNNVNTVQLHSAMLVQVE